MPARPWATLPAALHAEAQPERAGVGLDRARAGRVGLTGPRAGRRWNAAAAGRPGRDGRRLGQNAGGGGGELGVGPAATRHRARGKVRVAEGRLGR